MRGLLVSILILFCVAVGVGIYRNAQRDVSTDIPISPTASSSETAPFPMLPDGYIIPGQRSYYINHTYHFLFEKPNGFSVEEYGVADPDPQVLLKDRGGAKAMLVWIYPVGNNVTQVTNSLVLKIDPSVSNISAVVSVSMGDASGVSFDADGGTWDDGRQYWFIHNGILFRVYTAARAQDADAAMLSTWRFTDSSKK